MAGGGSVVLTAVPTRAPTWLLGDRLGVQVWTVAEAAPFTASLYARGGQRIVLVADRLVGTPREGRAIRWALELIAGGFCGYVEQEATHVT